MSEKRALKLTQPSSMFVYFWLDGFRVVAVVVMEVDHE